MVYRMTFLPCLYVPEEPFVWYRRHAYCFPEALRIFVGDSDDQDLSHYQTSLAPSVVNSRRWYQVIWRDRPQGWIAGIP